MRWYFKPSTWLVLIVIFLAIFVWPTEYRYEHDAGRLVRINRWSGEVRYLNGNSFTIVAPDTLCPWGVECTESRFDRWKALTDSLQRR